MKARRHLDPTMILFVAVGLGLTSCSGAEERSDQVDPVGEFALVSVNGMAVPADITEQGMTIRVSSGAMSINADGTCSSSTVFQAPSGEEVTRDVTATYTMEGDSLTLDWEGAGTTVGVLVGDTFTMDNHGTIFVYERGR